MFSDTTFQSLSQMLQMTLWILTYSKPFLFSFLLHAVRTSRRKQNTTVNVQGERANTGHLISIYTVASSAF